MEKKKLNIPIIHIIGLPGAGKTTLGEKLSNKFKIPIYRIGEYRSKFPVSIIGEADAWLALFQNLSRKKWKNCILETTGLNCRESFLKAAFPFSQIVKIKLEARKSVLYTRLRKKKKNEQGGKWLFSTEYRDKFEFVKKLFKEFEKIHADIKINTNELKPAEVYKIALEELKKLMIV
ncbi:MAG: AAA family ATPase [Acidobacteriota bacterium]